MDPKHDLSPCNSFRELFVSLHKFMDALHLRHDD